MSSLSTSKSEQTKRRLVALGCVLVIIATFASIILQYRRKPDMVSLSHYAVAGEMLGMQTAKLLHDQGKIVILAYDTKQIPVPYATTQLDALRTTVQKKTHLTIEGVESLNYSSEGVAMTGMFHGETFGTLINKHSGVAAIVSLVGAPTLTDAEIRKLPRDRPKCLIYGIGIPGMQLRRLLHSGIIDAAVVGRFTPFPASATKPRTNEELFDRHYQIITPSTADSLPD
jgi:hypothetical protein